MKSHSCSEVWGVVVIVFTHCWGQNPASFLTSTTSKLLPDRDAEHHEDAPLLAARLCPAAKCESNYALPDNLSSVLSAANPINPGLCVTKDHVLPPANEPTQQKIDF
jgi:hypothetical protein